MRAGYGCKEIKTNAHGSEFISVALLQLANTLKDGCVTLCLGASVRVCQVGQCGREGQSNSLDNSRSSSSAFATSWC